MKAGIGNELRNLMRALEKQDQHEERVQQRKINRANRRRQSGPASSKPAPKRK